LNVSTITPIALFAYNRPEHLRATVDALRNNVEASNSPLYVFSDAAKNAGSAEAVRQVRDYLRHIDGFGEVHIVRRTENFGLARSIIEGVTRVCEKHGRAIVLEDDIVVSPHFLKYMNEGLDRYEDDHRVISIHGYQYPVRAALPETFFMRGADCWGWATWMRGWALFEQDGQRLLNKLMERRLSTYFDYDGAYPYTKMLRQQIKGENDSWAIRWHASAFLLNMLTLCPGRSLVQNIGTDGSGVHCASTTEFSGGVAQGPVDVREIPVEENVAARREIVRFHRAARASTAVRLARRLAALMRRAG